MVNGFFSLLLEGLLKRCGASPKLGKIVLLECILLYKLPTLSRAVFPHRSFFFQ